MKDKTASLLSVEEFYDATSEFYEQMIDFPKNLMLRIGAYKNIFPGKSIVADIGCGIGLDSIALAKNGHKVVAFDISPRMINAAKINCQKYNAGVDFKISSVTSIPKSYKIKFNSIVCVGNTIAHLNRKELSTALINIYSLLQPGGKLFIHILNYERIVRLGKRVNNIANKEGKTIIRFYDFFKSFILFNILSFEVTNPKQYQLITTKHFPHSQKEILTALKKSGFSKIKSYGNFALQKYLPSESKDLFIEASK